MARIVLCEKCGEERPHCARGLCRQCYNQQWDKAHRKQRREATRQYRAANLEKVRECQRQWNEANPNYSRQYREDNWEEWAEYNRQWREAHREELREYGRQYREDNPEKERAHSCRRRARKANATIGPVDEAAIYERDKVCIYCGSGEDLTIDHIIALDNGGPHRQDNLVVACRSCNSSKRAKPLMAWLETQPYSVAWLF